MTIETLVLGPLENNTFVLADEARHVAVVVDPSFEAAQAARLLLERGWDLRAIWLTHAHFDHFAGVQELQQAWQRAGRAEVPVGLHPADLDLWRLRGGADYFGIAVRPGPAPSLAFAHGQRLAVGGVEVEVRHAPGHSAGHVLFYVPAEHAALVGDVVFLGSIGRTDLPGGDLDTLLESIRTQVFTLPESTRLLTGHGPETSVEHEKRYNPFVRGE